VKKSVKDPVKEVAPPVKEEPKAPAEETAPSTKETATPAVAQTEQSKPQPAKQLETTKPAETPKPVGTSKPVEAPKPTVAATPAAVKLDKYEAMDARVRTGAYRIVGTDHVEKVKEGDNLKRIAKRTLGQDMECYLEVYNNLTSTSELKKGQEIKIPKLELKKKKQSKSSR
jgi:pyruvate/2-oxoglutarate dehydrogenase complex dihydrolipoamide acyltransferase (E2) component